MKGGTIVRISSSLLPLSLIACFRGVPFAGEATLEVTVVDEVGAPVQQAQVAAGWNTPLPPRTGWGAGAGVEVKGVTDDAGSVTLAVGGLPGVSVKKEGYYSNGLSNMVDTPKLFTVEPFALNNVKTKVVLTKVREPIAMCVKKVKDPTGRIPEPGKPYGFDLEVGDWVAPNGAGKVADFIFTMNSEYRGERDYDYVCTLNFSNDGDGIQLFPVSMAYRRNELRLPREAPLDGYLPEWKWNTLMGAGPAKFAVAGAPSNSGPKRDQEDDNYIYRVRTKRDAEGKIVSARYGKIHGRLAPCIRPLFPQTPRQTYPCVEFLYYFNPADSHSLEWNKTNLLQGQDISAEP